MRDPEDRQDHCVWASVVNDGSNSTASTPPSKRAGPQILPSQLLPRDVAEWVAKIAQIPDGYWEYFCDDLVDTVRRICRRDRRAVSSKPGEALKKAAEAALALNKAFGSLTKADREWVENLLNQEPSHYRERLNGREPAEFSFFLHDVPEPLRSLSQTVFLVARLLSTAVGKVPPLMVGVDKLPVKRGRQKGSVENPTFHHLVEHLLIAASLWGGRLTLDKNFGTGTLLEALDRLRLHLPRGVIPSDLAPHLATLQRIKTAHEKFQRLPDRL